MCRLTDANNTAKFRACSWSYGRWRLPVRCGACPSIVGWRCRDVCCSLSKSICGSVLQIKSSKSVEKVRGHCIIHGVSSLQLSHVLWLVSLLTSCDGKQRMEVAHFMLWGADVGMHGRFIRSVEGHDRPPSPGLGVRAFPGQHYWGPDRRRSPSSVWSSTRPLACCLRSSDCSHV